MAQDLKTSPDVSLWSSVLQCVAECCSVLQCVAVCCRVLQCVHYGVVQSRCCTDLICLIPLTAAHH